MQDKAVRLLQVVAFVLLLALLGTVAQAGESVRLYWDPNESAPEASCVNFTDDGGQLVTDIQPGTYLLEGFDFIVEIRPSPEDNEDPPYSLNRDGTIYHVPGCRYFTFDRPMQDPTECKDKQCRPCKICGH